MKKFVVTINYIAQTTITVESSDFDLARLKALKKFKKHKKKVRILGSDAICVQLKQK